MLTGATGSLGVFLVHQLANLPQDFIHRIVCFVRAANDQEAHERVIGILKKRNLEVGTHRLETLAADVTTDQLGLPSGTYEDLARSADVVIHVSHRCAVLPLGLLLNGTSADSSGGLAGPFRQ